MIERIWSDVPAALLPSLIALVALSQIRLSYQTIAHLAFVTWLSSLMMPALGDGEDYNLGWMVLLVSFIPPSLLMPSGLASATANVVFILSYVMLLRRSGAMVYFSLFNPFIALAAMSFYLFAGSTGFLGLDLVFQYQPDHRIYFGGGFWICAIVLMAIAYSKYKSDCIILREVYPITCVLLGMFIVFTAISIFAHWSTKQKPEWARVGFVDFLLDRATIVTCMDEYRGNFMDDLECDNRVVIWDLRSKQAIKKFPIKSEVPARYALSASGKMIAFTSPPEPPESNLSSAVALISIETGEQLGLLEGHTDAINAVAISRDGSIVATASDDKSARIWRVADGTELARFDNGAPVSSIALTNDGNKLAFHSAKTIVIVSDWGSEMPTRKVLNVQDTRPAKVAFSPDSSMLICVSFQGEVTTWKLDEAATPQVQSSGIQGISCIAVDPTKALIALGSYENGLVIWDYQQGETCHRYPQRLPVNSVAFSPDGQWLVVGEGGAWEFEGAKAIRIWNVLTGELESSCDPADARLLEINPAK